MTHPDALSLFVIFRSPADYPGRVVLREQRVYSPKLTAAPEGFRLADNRDPRAPVWIAIEPTLVCDSVDEARAWLHEHHPDLICMERDPRDVPSIVETWV